MLGRGYAVRAFRLNSSFDSMASIMPHRDIGHLTVQNIPVNDLSLATLASRTAKLLSSSFSTTIKNTFLVKKIKYFLHASALTQGEQDNLLVMIAKGDASTAEVAAALTEINTVGPEDTTQARTADNAWNIWQNTVRAMESRGSATEAQLVAEISLGKGMPAISEQGVAVYLFNNDAVGLAGTPLVNGLVQLWGVWLRD